MCVKVSCWVLVVTVAPSNVDGYFVIRYLFVVSLCVRILCWVLVVTVAPSNVDGNFVSRYLFVLSLCVLDFHVGSWL